MDELSRHPSEGASFPDAALGKRVQHAGLATVDAVVLEGPWLGTIRRPSRTPLQASSSAPPATADPEQTGPSNRAHEASPVAAHRDFSAPSPPHTSGRSLATRRRRRCFRQRCVDGMNPQQLSWDFTFFSENSILASESGELFLHRFPPWLHVRSRCGGRSTTGGTSRDLWTCSLRGPDRTARRSCLHG